MHRNNHFCPYCLTVTKAGTKCGNCGQKTITISDKARVPKKGASKKDWEALFKALPHILIASPYTKALADMGFKTRDKKS